jgi:hypothetical protein
MSPSAGVHGESTLIVSKPAMPSGVNPSAGTSPACVICSTIVWRSIASDIARRWFTSVTFLRLNP